MSTVAKRQKHRTLTKAEKQQQIARAMKQAQTRLRTIATTGTNGKTSTTHFVHSILSELSEREAIPAARISTIGGCVSTKPEPWTVRDNPGRVFSKTIDQAMRSGARWLALEVTSKALMSGFAQRWPPEVAVFTNLSRDHLDLHESPEAYLASKAQLFLALGHPLAGTQRTRVAVLNRSDEVSALLDEVMPSRVKVLSYGSKQTAGAAGANAAYKADLDLCVEQAEPAESGQRVHLSGKLAERFGGTLELSVRGEFQALNAAAAALATHAIGAPPELIKRALQNVTQIDGRLQLVTQKPRTFVDYAHTPAALKAALTATRKIAKSARVIVVFGCGGDRDKGKRPLMGKVASELADVVWLTSDNARSESPKAIADAVQKGASGSADWVIELDRRRAIAGAVLAAESDDVVLVAGKGHEREQSTGGVTTKFDDAAELTRAVEALS